MISSSENLCLNHIQTLIDNFCLQFPPEQFANEYARIHFLEPSFEHYKCVKEMPKNIYINTIEYDLTSLNGIFLFLIGYNAIRMTIFPSISIAMSL